MTEHDEQRYDPVQQWRDRLQKFKDQCNREYRERHPEEQPLRPRPLDSILKAVASVIDKEFAAIKAEMRSEIDAFKLHTQRQIEMVLRPRRRKKMTQKEVDNHIMSKRGLPEEAFEK
jgi:hypothetical protein